jgi:hypothetical protein
MTVDVFLQSMRRELEGVVPAAELESMLAEIGSHLSESVAEFKAAGHPDPEEAAIAEFGGARSIAGAVQSSRGGFRFTENERRMLSVASLLIFFPVVADLAVDLSSFATGSDSALTLLAIPGLGVLGYLLHRSLSVRRILALPLAGLVLISFLLAVVGGGFTRAVSYGSTSYTQARGTAIKRMQSLERFTLPHAQARVAELETGVQAFASGPASPDLTRFRTYRGYLAPAMETNVPSSFTSDPRWRIDAARYRVEPRFEDAARAWAENAPEIVGFARVSAAGVQREIDQLGEVASSSWLASVRADWWEKSAIACMGFVLLLAAHATGVVIGALSRRRRARRTA